MTEGGVYERTVLDGKVTVPEKHAAQVVGILVGGVQVIAYPQVQSDGSIEVDREDGLEVEVVVPSYESVEFHSEVDG